MEVSEDMDVRLVAHTPDPDMVCELAARTCTSREMPETPLEIRALRSALASGHTSVAENAVFTFAVTGVSRVLLAQLSRHRHISLAVQSQRYVGMEGFGYAVPGSVRDSDAEVYDITSGRAGKATVPEMYDRWMEMADEVYTTLVENGVPPEDARYVLPSACTTDLTLTVNAREALHIMGLRLCTRAQDEFRELAERMLELVRPVAPVLFENAGPQCRALGHCPEKRSCGRVRGLGADTREGDSGGAEAQIMGADGA